MTTKIWRGDSIAVAQVTRLTPSGVEIGDTFSATINGKSVTVTATAATADNVCTLLAAAIAASDIPEFQEVTASVSSGTVLLTANTPGIPFTVTASAANASTMAVTVVETTAGAGAVAGTNMTQTFKIPVSAVGTFTIVIGDQQTSALTVGDSAGTVQTAIEGLSTIGSGNATVTRSTDSNDYTYVVTFVGTLAGVRVATAIVRLTSTKPLIRTTQAGATTGTPTDEIQTVDYGTNSSATWTLTLDSQTTTSLSGVSTATDVQNAMISLSNVEVVTVTKNGTVFEITFTSIDGSADQSKLSASSFSASGSSVYTISVTVVNPVGATAAVNEVQTVTISGTPTGGTFTLTFGGNTTSSIAYNASASTVQTALQALASIGSGNATVAGSAGGPYTVTFAGSLAGANQALMTASGASLTGGNAQAIAVDAVTASSGPSHWDDAANWSPSGVPTTGDAVIFEQTGEDCLYGLAQSGVTLASLTIDNSWNGKIGLPRENENAYREYREEQLTCGITAITIGTGEGTGPTRVYLDTGSVQTTIEIRNTGSGGELPAVCWSGTHSSNAVTIWDGEFGSAPYSDLSATINTIVMYGGSAVLRNTTLNTSVKANGNPIRAYACTLGTKVLEI